MHVGDVNGLGLEITPEAVLEATDSRELEALLPLELDYAAKALVFSVQNVEFQPAAEGYLNAVCQCFATGGVQGELPERSWCRLCRGMENSAPIHVAKTEGAMGSVDWNHEPALAVLWNDKIKAKLTFSKFFLICGAP